MPRLLIVYGTTDGQTAKIARFLANEFESLGAAVDLVEAGTSDPDPSDFAAVLVAASVHAGGYQRSVVRWVRSHAEAMSDVPSVFVSVCLGVLQEDPKVERDLTGIIERFAARTGWNPPSTKRVAGALRYSRYGWLKRIVMRRIAGKAGGGTDVSRDYEYTDWADLAAFAVTFNAMHQRIACHGTRAAVKVPKARPQLR